jgi:hypothetical protein
MVKVLKAESPVGDIVMKVPKVVVTSAFAEFITMKEKLIMQSVAIEVAKVP